MKNWLSRFQAVLKTVAICCLLTASLVVGWLLQKNIGAAHAESPATGNKPVSVEKLKRVNHNTFILPEGYPERIGIQFGEIKRSDQPQPLPPLQATLALDADKQVRIHSRFAGEIASLGTVTVKINKSPGEPDRLETHSIRYLDHVKKGDVLAIVWSKDLGEKKSELIEACSKMQADEVTLKRLQKLETEGASSERSLRDAQRALDADRIAIEKIERTLRSWRLSEQEIAAVREEANQAKQGNSLDKQQNWARVEVRAPQDGVILEKNCGVGDIIDTNLDLFKIGQVDQLKVWAHVYEEDLPLLESLPKPYAWEICLPAQAGATCKGELQQIGAVIDPNQHTALVMGMVQNDQGRLRIGQFVSVKITLPAVSNEFLLPVDAVVEDGKESVIFVRNESDPKQFERRAVQVVRRTRENVILRGNSEGLHAGQHVVTQGALLLREALDEQAEVQGPSKS